MSGQGTAPSSTILYGRPVASDWSTPPTLSPNEVDTPAIVKPPVIPFQVSPHPSTSRHTINSSQKLSQSHDSTLFSEQYSANFIPYYIQGAKSRKASETSNSNPIPTALVTPLPGSSPPQPAGEHDYQPWILSGKEREYGHKGRKNESGKQECRELMLSDDNTVELIDKWKTLIDTKDNILKQKSVQIERQKSTITKLQHDVQELENKLHQQFVAQIREQGGAVLEARLQALEAENSFIKAQLSEALSSHKRGFSSISSKLDQKEYELHSAVKFHEESSKKYQLEVSRLEDKVSKQQMHTRGLEQMLADSQAECEHHLEQMQKLNKYMEHMPSMEEYQAMEMQNQKTRARCEALTKRLTETESVLETTLERVKIKDLRIYSFEGMKAELEDMRLRLESHKETLSVVEPENKRLKQDCQHLKKVVVEAEKRCRQELQAMRERHRARFIEATAKLRSQYKSLAKRARALESQLTRNSDAMVALNTELQSSQGKIGALKSSVKDLVLQNQELLEKNLTLQESTTEVMKVSSSLTEAQSCAAQTLGFELSQCIGEFESLIGLSMSLLDGHEPTPAMLFGSDGCALPSDEDDYGIELRLHQVKHLRKKIEELRSLISEHFATQLSSACNVQ